VRTVKKTTARAVEADDGTAHEYLLDPGVRSDI
jgi:hypothetical protein